MRRTTFLAGFAAAIAARPLFPMLTPAAPVARVLVIPRSMYETPTLAQQDASERAFHRRMGERWAAEERAMIREIFGIA